MMWQLISSGRYLHKFKTIDMQILADKNYLKFVIFKVICGCPTDNRNTYVQFLSLKRFLYLHNIMIHCVV